MGHYYYCACCICCLSEEERIAIDINNEIKRILAEQKKRQRREIKVLLLGEMFLTVFNQNCIKIGNMLIYFNFQCFSKSESIFNHSIKCCVSKWHKGFVTSSLEGNFLTGVPIRADSTCIVIKNNFTFLVLR